MTKRTMLGLGVALAAFVFVWIAQANALEVHKMYVIDDEIISDIASAMRHDASQTVTIVAYAEVWTHDTVDELIPKARDAQRKLVDKGIGINRINLLFSDATGFAPENEKLLGGKAYPKPFADGVYLCLD